MPEFAETIHGLCRQQRDFTVRQLSLILHCYQHPNDHEKRGTKGLAALMTVSKPAITRAMDRIEGAGMGTRAKHPTDRRGIVFNLTATGRQFVAPLLGVAPGGHRKQPKQKAGVGNSAPA